MKKPTAIYGILLVSFSVQAKFIENLGNPGMFPQEDQKLEILQGILLDSATKAFSTINPDITLETSLTEIKKQKPVGVNAMNVLLNEASSGVQAYGCSLNLEQGVAYQVYMNGIKSPSNPSGTISRVGDLLPILNSRIECH